MYFMIEVDNPEDIGVNELRRISLGGEIRFISKVLYFDIQASGCDVHPATKGDE